MITIPVATADDGTLYPSTPIPENAIAVLCDGVNYTVYEPGDIVPSTI